MLLVIFPLNNCEKHFIPPVYVYKCPVYVFYYAGIKFNLFFVFFMHKFVG